eukprot:535785-Pelagomonas_calceolata.AAC.4
MGTQRSTWQAKHVFFPLISTRLGRYQHAGSAAQATHLHFKIWSEASLSKICIPALQSESGARLHCSQHAFKLPMHLLSTLPVTKLA